MARHRAQHVVHQKPTPWFTAQDWFTPDHAEHQIQERFVGSGRTRHAEFRAKLWWPERYHQAYHVPKGIEGQPF